MPNPAPHTVPKGAPQPKRQVAMFVANNMVSDRRVIREAATVAAAGFAVTVHAIAQRREALPLREEHPDGFTIVRHRLGLIPPVLPIRPRLLALLLHPFWCALAITVAVARRIQLPLAGAALLAIRWTSWATLAARASQSAQILHAHDLSGALPALVTLRTNPTATLLYDSHEVFLESGRWAKSPGFVRRLLATRFEQPALRHAAALIAVNPQVIEELAKRYEIPERQVVTYNCPPAWNPEPRGTELRAAIGVDAAAQVVLYHGGFSAHRGLEELLEAKRDPRLANAHLVFLGYGSLEPILRAAAAEPAYGGRVHVLKAVAPDVLDRWVSGADVGMCTVLPSTLNHRISTPNKLFESIGAGVPVIASDFATMRDIVLGDPDGPLGAVCDPTSAHEVATAIHSILSMSLTDRAALRARCMRAAAARWNWEAQAARLTALYQSLPPTNNSSMSRPPHRLVIGMLNTAGQARQWANALRDNTAATIESWAMQRPEETEISFAADRSYPLINGAIDQAFTDLLRAPLKPTHLIIESGKPISVRGSVHRMLFQAAIARRHGIRLALVFHGSDIRVPSLHAAVHPDSPFHENLDGLTAKLEQKTKQMRRWLRVWPFPIFISTLDLKRFVPRGEWLPVVPDASWFAPMSAISIDRSRPRVLHLPSRRVLFQSEQVDRICQALHEAGVIEYQSVTGVPPVNVRQLVEWSDIVIDKIGLGVSGVMGAEVMASGRLLIGDVDQIARAEVPDLPLIQSSIATLESVIRDLVADRSTWAASAAAGQAFARKYHDGRYSAAVLAKWMGVPVNQP